jgi:hypothetical protein
LPRRAIREDLGTAITAEGDLVVKGDSGVGKSALVMDAIEPGELGEDCQAIVLNLRQLPTSQLELVALLSAPVDELFSQLTAPDRLLVIDSAEGAAEDHGEVFSYLLRSARGAGLRVIAVASTEGAGAATQLMTSEPREYVVTGLDDEELATAGAHIPALQRLVDNPRARELLRRPIVIDLLARADDPGLPLSEAQALDHIWHHLVRNGNRRDLGAPDAREQVMLRLAAHAVSKGDVDDLLARLDHAAVDGLRRSGLLLPASRLPWERIPEFKHDLLRAYYHHKSADWKDNKPFSLQSWSAGELAKLPTYYVMDLASNMAETVAGEMPSAELIAANQWLPDRELAFYSDEYARTGFQGGLQWYRCGTSGVFTAELETWSGRSIDVPSCFISGKQDWGTYQRPGAFDAMQKTACTRMLGCHLVDGAGHWVQQEQPNQVISLLRQFLKRAAEDAADEPFSA